MTTTTYNPLSDMNQIKDRLIAIMGKHEELVRLTMPAAGTPGETGTGSWYGHHCFDTSYLEGTITDSSCGIYLDTVLTAVSPAGVREVTVEITVVCHRDAVALSEEEKTFCNSMGIYGNRADCLCQMIHASILSQPAMADFMKSYSISSIHLSGQEAVRISTPAPGFYGKTLAYTYHTACQTTTAGKG